MRKMWMKELAGLAEKVGGWEKEMDDVSVPFLVLIWTLRSFLPRSRAFQMSYGILDRDVKPSGASWAGRY